MAHYSRVRAPLGWSGGTVIEPGEQELFDLRYGAINGDDGGSWTPGAEITINGTNGFKALVLKGGNLGNGGVAGTPMVTIDSTGIHSPGITVFNATPITGNFIIPSGVNNYWELAGNFGLSGTLNISGGNFEGTASSIHFTGTTAGAMYPTRTGTTPTATDYAVFIGAAIGQSADTDILAGNTGNPGTFVIESPVGLRVADFHTRFNFNVNHTAVKVRLRGDAGHVLMPGTPPTVSLIAVTQTGSNTVISTVAVSGATAVATYEAGVDLSLTFTGFPVAGTHYVIRVTTESGLNARTDLNLISIRASGSVTRFGATGEVLCFLQ